MSVQVILLWIVKYASQLLTVQIWIQLDWGKSYEIEESCAKNYCFWVGVWNYNILSLDAAMQEPVCAYLHKLDSPQRSTTLTLQMDATPKLLRTHMQLVKQGFSSTDVSEPCRHWRSALLSVSCKYQFLCFLNCQDGIPDTSAHLAHCSRTAEAAEISPSSWTNLCGQKWGLSLVAATCLALGRIYIFRWMSPLADCGCSIWLQLCRSEGLAYTLVTGLVTCEMGIWNLAAILLKGQKVKVTPLYSQRLTWL